MAVGLIYITTHTSRRRAVQNLKPLLESGYLATKWDSLRDEDEERRGTSRAQKREGGRERETTSREERELD